MMARRMRVTAMGALAMLALPLAVTEAGAQTPKNAIRPLLDCRKIGDTAERLSCFDRESAALDEADRKKELTVMDKEDVRKTRRSLFGLNLSGLPFLGDGEDDNDVKKTEAEKEAASSITAKVASVRALGNGKWAFDLDDGAHWVTTEAITYREPETGGTVVIKKGMVGGYRASFDGSTRLVRVRRVN